MARPGHPGRQDHLVKRRLAAARGHREGRRPRALTVRVWRDPGGQPLRQGTWLTGLLWVAALGVHLGYDDLVIGGGKDGDATGNPTILLYPVISLTIQRFVLLTRVSRMESRGELGRGPRGPVTGRAGYQAGADGQRP